MPRIIKLHRYIDHDSQITPIDFQVTRSKDGLSAKKRIHTMSATTTNSPYEGMHSAHLNILLCTYPDQDKKI
ncbi:hypothetical protein DPMN_138147 [Dreissena polymorpha]|uniref:Uncharacterized protein n=1 Tax=Dreissena polymorpha TaxID=45954 RepID=A0A9D4G3B5_DREPO|nr:hypothetical protein DPMN_138147 [Dreissena polymorpha]